MDKTIESRALRFGGRCEQEQRYEMCSRAKMAISALSNLWTAWHDMLAWPGLLANHVHPPMH